MKTLIENFSKQLADAIEIGKNATLTKHTKEIKNVLICGLGGSGIGGSIVSELVCPEANVPISLSKGYFIPAYVNKNSLVLISSYSGNTEETIHCLELAMKKNAKIVCITSGGGIAKTAKKKNLDLILVPGGMPPRSCLGYSFTQLLSILRFNAVVKNDFTADLQSAIQLIDAEEKDMIVEAKLISEKLYKKIPVIYSTTYFEGVSIRFRQQLNENAKVLCWHHVIPEMNHNELVGWAGGNESFSIVMFRDRDEYKRNDARIEINKEVIKKYASGITEVWSKGKSQIEKIVYFIHLGDWVSFFLAERSGVDAVEVNVINHLKSQLSKL